MCNVQGTEKRGRFIVIEGIDGCGKTTQVKILKKRIAEDGGYAFTTSEPTCKANHAPTRAGALLASVLKGKVKMPDSAIAGLFLTDRIMHNKDEKLGIDALLARGSDVICTRYYYSSLVYQGTPELYDWVFDANFNCPDIRTPDVCIFLDIDPKVSHSRVMGRSTEAEIYEQNTEMLVKAREKYINVLNKVKSARPEQRIEFVDASRGIDEIADRIYEIVKSIEI
jgi:dTMP kinase